MDGPDPRARARENASGIAALIVTGIWLPLTIVGYAVVVPLVGVLFNEEDDEESERTTDRASGREHRLSDEDDDALATLRDRYARGELTDEQFERKVERLLETDTVENAAEHRRDWGDGEHRDSDADRRRDRDDDRITERE